MANPKPGDIIEKAWSAYGAFTCNIQPNRTAGGGRGWHHSGTTLLTPAGEVQIKSATVQGDSGNLGEPPHNDGYYWDVVWYAKSPNLGHTGWVEIARVEQVWFRYTESSYEDVLLIESANITNVVLTGTANYVLIASEEACTDVCCGTTSDHYPWCNPDGEHWDGVSPEWCDYPDADGSYGQALMVKLTGMQIGPRTLHFTGGSANWSTVDASIVNELIAFDNEESHVQIGVVPINSPDSYASHVGFCFGTGVSCTHGGGYPEPHSGGSIVGGDEVYTYGYGQMQWQSKCTFTNSGGPRYVGYMPGQSFKYNWSFPDLPTTPVTLKCTDGMNSYSGDPDYKWVSDANTTFTVTGSLSRTYTYTGSAAVELCGLAVPGTKPTNWCDWKFNAATGEYDAYAGILIDDTPELVMMPMYPALGQHYSYIYHPTVAALGQPYFPAAEDGSSPEWGDWRLPVALHDWTWDGPKLAHHSGIELWRFKDTAPFTALMNCSIAAQGGTRLRITTTGPASAQADYIPAAVLAANTTLGATTITVDTTAGFPDVGDLIIDEANKVSYTGKDLTHFTGCTGVTAHSHSPLDLKVELVGPWLSHYRFVTLEWKPMLADGTLDTAGSMRVYFGAKYWDVAYNEADLQESGYLETRIDLCKPHGECLASSAQQSYLDFGLPRSVGRLDGDGVYLAGTEHGVDLNNCDDLQPARSRTAENAWYWGVDKCELVKFDLLSASKKYDIGFIHGDIVDAVKFVTDPQWGWRDNRVTDIGGAGALDQFIAKVRSGLIDLPPDMAHEADYTIVCLDEILGWILIDGMVAAEVSGKVWLYDTTLGAGCPSQYVMLQLGVQSYGGVWASNLSILPQRPERIPLATITQATALTTDQATTVVSPYLDANGLCVGDESEFAEKGQIVVWLTVMSDDDPPVPITYPVILTYTSTGTGRLKITDSTVLYDDGSPPNLLLTGGEPVVQYSFLSDWRDTRHLVGSHAGITITDTLTSLTAQAQYDRVQIALGGGMGLFEVTCTKRFGNRIHGLVFAGNAPAVNKTITIQHGSSSTTATTDSGGAFTADIPHQADTDGVLALTGGTIVHDGALLRECCQGESVAIPTRQRRLTFCGLGASGNSDSLKYNPATGALLFR